MVKGVFLGFASLASGRIPGGLIGPCGPSGPVGIVRATAVAASAGLGSLMRFAAFLSLNLGILNLMPIPALDGGRLFFIVLEGIRRKPINPIQEQRVHYGGLVILLALIVLISINDVSRLGTVPRRPGHRVLRVSERLPVVAEGEHQAGEVMAITGLVPRRKTAPVRVGDVVIGGAAPIAVQSMTKTDTRDVAGTVDQIARMARRRSRRGRVRREQPRGGPGDGRHRREASYRSSPISTSITGWR